MLSRKNHASGVLRLIVEPGIGSSAPVTCSSDRPLMFTVVLGNLTKVSIRLVTSNQAHRSPIDRRVDAELDVASELHPPKRKRSGTSDRIGFSVIPQRHA